MTDNWRFAISMLTSSAVFASALLFGVRFPAERPFRRICVLTGVVVVGGMLFARYGHLYANLPPAVYYGVPASITLLLPIANLRMSRSEALQYFPFAVLMGPLIHNCVLASTWMARLHAIPISDTVAARVGVELLSVLTARRLLILRMARRAKKAPLPIPLYVYCTNIV